MDLRPTDQQPPSPGSDPGVSSWLSPWTAAGFFRELQQLSPLRVISINGPSVFETICELGPFGVANETLNVIAKSYHWHLDLQRFRFLRSVDSVHERSGRQVLFFELAEAPDAPPFLLVSLYRGSGEAFGEKREALFATLHREMRNGVALRLETPGDRANEEGRS